MANHSSIAASIIDLLGLTGHPIPGGGLAPRVPTANSQALASQEFQNLGTVVNPDIWTAYGNVMTRPTTYGAMQQVWQEMSTWDLLAAALVQVVDEAVQHDETCPGSIWFECDNSDVEKEVNKMLEDLCVEDVITGQFWFVAALGNSFEKLSYSRGEGVTGLSFVDPMRIRRYWLKHNHQCVGFKYDLEKPADRDNLFQQGETVIPRVDVNSAVNVSEPLWYPWDFLHFRRMYRLRESEHGEPLFEEAQGIYKKVRIALDQMVVHRAQVQPDRYVVNIDTGEQAVTDQMKTVHRWRQMLRSKFAFGQGSASGSSDPTDFKSFYNALGLDTVVYLAKPKGFTHALEKLAGTPNVPDVYDIEMLTNLFFSIIGMPKEWLGIGQKGENSPASGKALLAQDVRFLRKIKAIRRPIVNGYRWLGYFHAALRGHDVNNLNIRAKMSEIGSLDDQVKLEMLKLQAEALNELGDVMDKYHLPREAWVEVIFKRYMRLPDDIINAFITALPDEVPTQEGKAKIARVKKSLTESALLAEIKTKFDGNPRANWLVKELSDLSAGAKRGNRGPGPHYFAESDVIKVPKVRSGDQIIDSLGLTPEEAKRTVETANRSGWRRFSYSA